MICCRKCNSMCDPGDLIGGVCDDCRDDEEKEERRTSMVAKYMISSYVQLEFNFENVRWDNA